MIPILSALLNRALAPLRDLLRVAGVVAFLAGCLWVLGNVLINIGARDIFYTGTFGLATTILASVVGDFYEEYSSHVGFIVIGAIVLQSGITIDKPLNELTDLARLVIPENATIFYLIFAFLLYITVKMAVKLDKKEEGKVDSKSTTLLKATFMIGFQFCLAFFLWDYVPTIIDIFNLPNEADAMRAGIASGTIITLGQGIYSGLNPIKGWAFSR